MRVFFVIDEAYPFFKIGGLGDVGGSLPSALSDLGVKISLVLPNHPQMTGINDYTFFKKVNIIYGPDTLPVIITRGLYPDSQIPVYLIGEDRYISKPTDASDNHADKFAVFSLGVAAFIKHLPEADRPQLIHLNDWHTALIPLIFKHLFSDSDQKYLLTIHNLMYQGSTTTPVAEKLHLKKSDCKYLNWDLQDHNLNILMEGILHANGINTVSPRYAKEILTQEYGENLHTVIADHQKTIYGILNGLNIKDFDPGSDQNLYQAYDINSFIQGKSANKLKLQQALGLELNPAQLLIGYVGRIDANQKGVQLVIEAIKNHKLTTSDQQFIFLGVGDNELEQKLHQIADRLPNYQIITRYDDQLARQIYAASDLLLIPSKFEPCGLIQMIANRYGSLPVARATGGLVDTIQDGVNGFLFPDYTSESMLEALGRAVKVIRHPEQRNAMIKNAMSRDFSWDKTAGQYLSLYQSIINQPAS